MLVVVPRLVNLNTETANRIASEFGITLEVIEEKFSEYVPKGSIISQTPIEDELIKSSRPVSIVVSKGRGKFEMPNLVGKSFYEAQKEIIENHLKLGRITEVESTSNVVGVVGGSIPSTSSNGWKDTSIWKWRSLLFCHA
ncbi:MAG: PASTA domain-containing protein [Caldisericia bacterium]